MDRGLIPHSDVRPKRRLPKVAVAYNKRRKDRGMASIGLFDLSPKDGPFPSNRDKISPAPKGKWLQF